MEKKVAIKNPVTDLAFTYGVTILIFGVAALATTERLWGISWFGYNSIYVGIAAASIAVVIFPLSLKIIGGNRSAEPKPVSFALTTFLVSVLFVSGFILLRNRTHFLGDGYTLMSSLADHQAIFMKARNYGESLLHLKLFQMLGGSGRPTALLSYQIISVAAGLSFLTVTAFLSSRLLDKSIDRLLLLLVIITGGQSLLFFGYVENYSLFACSIALFCFTALAIEQKRWHRLSILLPQALALFFHIFGLLFIPTTILLLIGDVSLVRRIQRMKSKTKLLGGILLGVAALAALHFVSEKSLTIQLAIAPVLANRFTADGYTLFSLAHLLDYLNLILMLLPGLPLLLVARLNSRNEKKDRPRIWMISVITIPLAAVFVLDPKLGMPRDWDLFAFAMIPTVILFPYRLLSQNSTRFSRIAVFLAAALGLLVLLARALPLVDETRSIEMIDNYSALDKTKSRLTSILLNNYYIEKGDSTAALQVKIRRTATYPEEIMFERARSEYLKENFTGARLGAMEVLRLNPIYTDAYGLIASSFGRLKEQDSALYYFNIANHLNPYRPKFLAGLGLTLMRANRPDEAEPYLSRAVALDSTDADALFGLYWLGRQQGRLAESIWLLERAVKQKDASTHMKITLMRHYLESGDGRKALQFYRSDPELQADTALSRIMKSVGEI